jgi:uncharacterized cupredoxin-like copper-binding protein
MLSQTRRCALACVPVLAVVLALAACGGGRSTSTPAGGGVAGASKSMVTATETEWAIRLSQTHLAAGPTTFVAVNKGKVAHSLEIDGPGVANERIPGTIAPGSSMRLTVTLKKGSYDVFCPLPGHKQRGMDVHVTVGGGSSGSTTKSKSSWG